MFNPPSLREGVDPKGQGEGGVNMPLHSRNDRITANFTV
jgi:hypothetical protein